MGECVETIILAQNFITRLFPSLIIPLTEEEINDQVNLKGYVEINPNIVTSNELKICVDKDGNLLNFGILYELYSNDKVLDTKSILTIIKNSGLTGDIILSSKTKKDKLSDINIIRRYSSSTIDDITFEKLIYTYIYLKKKMINTNILLYLFKKEFILNDNNFPSELKNVIILYKNILEMYPIKTNLSKKEEYRQLVEIINEVRYKDLITVVERREYDRSWRNNIDQRKLIVRELLGLLQKNSDFSY